MAERDYRQEVTDAIIKALEEGTAPWQRPIDEETAYAYSMPRNGVSGRSYNGGNALYLLFQQQMKGYDDPRWVTFKQANDQGWRIRKGEKGTGIEFWQFTRDETRINPESGQMEKVRVELDKPFVRYFTVFNANQIEGVPPLEIQPFNNWESHEAAERILKNSKAEIHHDGIDRNFYRPGTDSIHLARRESFLDQGHYYATALHEVGHWTGHETRLNRDGITGRHEFGSEGYAKEELRAEIASAFLSAEIKIPHDTGNHAAYVGSWIKVLKEDKNELFRAARDANSIADYVMELDKQQKIELSPEEETYRAQMQSRGVNIEFSQGRAVEGHYLGLREIEGLKYSVIENTPELKNRTEYLVPYQDHHKDIRKFRAVQYDGQNMTLAPAKIHEISQEHNTVAGLGLGGGME